MVQALKDGTLLQGGKHIIKRVLGQGGFGITYLAEQVSLGREVAIKEFFFKDGCVRLATGTVSMTAIGSPAQTKKYHGSQVTHCKLSEKHALRYISQAAKALK